MDSNPQKNNKPRFVVLQSNGNVGDYAMLINLVRRLKDRFPACEVDVLGDHIVDYAPMVGTNVLTCGAQHFSSGGGRLAGLIERLPKGRKLVMLLRCFSVILAARRRRRSGPKDHEGSDCRALVELLNDASCIVSCGGGYLNSIWWDRELWPKCACYAAAKALGKPVVLSGQGIGPIYSRIDSVILKSGLQHADWISLRGQGEGEKYLEEMGLPPSRFGAIGDDAVDLPTCSRQRVEQLARQEDLDPGKMHAVINVRFSAYSHGSSAEHASLLAGFVDTLIDRYDCQPVFVGLSYEDVGGIDDRTAAFDVVKNMKNHRAARIVMGRYEPGEIKGIVGLGTFGFGMSYHFAVFALTQGIPCFSFYGTDYYRLKCEGLYSQLGKAGWYQPLDRDGMANVLAEVESVKQRSDETRKNLMEHTQMMIERVDGVYDRIGLLLQQD